jgi:hypothetical protein
MSCYSASNNRPASTLCTEVHTLHHLIERFAFLSQDPALQPQSWSDSPSSGRGKAVIFTTGTMCGTRCAEFFSLRRAAGTPQAKAEVHYLLNKDLP